MRWCNRLFLTLFCCLAFLPLTGCQYMPETEGFSLPRLSLPGSKKPAAAAQEESRVAAPAAAPSIPAGPPLYCHVTGGTAKFGDKRRTFRKNDFTLPRDTRVKVTLTPVKGSGQTDFQAWFDHAGQKMVFCPVIIGPPDKKISCASLYALDDDLALGIKRTFDIPNAIQGGEISCAYDKAHLH